MGNILYFEPCGAEYTEKLYGVNCRVRTAFKNNAGQAYFFEVLCGHTNGGQRKDSSYIGCGYPRYKDYLVLEAACRLYPGKSRFANSKWDINTSGLAGMDVKYTKENILKLVNYGFSCSFDGIEFLPFLSGYHVLKEVKGKLMPGEYIANFGNEFAYDREATTRRLEARAQLSKRLTSEGLFGYGRSDNTSYWCADNGNLAVQLNISDEMRKAHGYNERCFEVAI